MEVADGKSSWQNIREKWKEKEPNIPTSRECANSRFHQESLLRNRFRAHRRQQKDSCRILWALGQVLNPETLSILSDPSSYQNVLKKSIRRVENTSKEICTEPHRKKCVINVNARFDLLPSLIVEISCSWKLLWAYSNMEKTPLVVSLSLGC